MKTITSSPIVPNASAGNSVCKPLKPSSRNKSANKTTRATSEYFHIHLFFNGFLSVLPEAAKLSSAPK
jgi:hypothetical protein